MIWCPQAEIPLGWRLVVLRCHWVECTLREVLNPSKGHNESSLKVPGLFMCRNKSHKSFLEFFI